MKPKKLKCYVITVSEYFPSYHPRKNEETNFPLKIVEMEKIHTIRANFDWWKKRIDAINRGEAYLSIRKWSDKPYRSPQVEIKRLYKVGIQEFRLPGPNSPITKHLRMTGENGFYYCSTIAENDGLKIDDFVSWFKPYKAGSLAIIHFTDFRY